MPARTQIKIRSVGAAFAVLLVAGHTVRAQDEAPTTTTSVPTPPAALEITTDVQGNVPKDIVGRWLAVSQVKLVSGQVRPITRSFEIRQGPEHLELAVANDVPGPVAAKVSTAAAAGQAWTPTEEDLRAVDQNWRVVAPDPHGYSKIEYRILGADAYPAEFQSDETTKDSAFAIAIRENYAGQQAVRSMYAVYGVRERTPTEMKGTSLTTTIAVAFVPLPITLKGDFQAYRIGPPPTAPSLLERLAAFFSGCGKR